MLPSNGKPKEVMDTIAFVDAREERAFMHCHHNLFPVLKTMKAKAQQRLADKQRGADK